MRLYMHMSHVHVVCNMYMYMVLHVCAGAHAPARASLGALLPSTYTRTIDYIYVNSDL